MIGSTYGNMKYVEELLNSELCNPPGGSIVKPFAVYRNAASGREYGDGYPSCEWVFQRMTVAYWNAMTAYLGSNQSAAVYIKTRIEGGTYQLYTGIMHRPKLKDEMTFGLRTWRDITFRFTMLEEYTPPGP
jgi:hypothetical protein